MATDGLHHAHLRKRAAAPGAHPPARQRLIRLMDRCLVVVGVLGPLMTLPQILKIFGERSAAGIALPTWGFYVVGNAFWIAYGIVHRERPIVVTYVGWLIVNSIVVTGAVLYG